jgi:hypothetical protein
MTNRPPCRISRAIPGFFPAQALIFSVTNHPSVPCRTVILIVARFFRKYYTDMTKNAGCTELVQPAN